MESITSTLKYDQYSDSGYEWIGEIPEHWDLVKLGSCLSPVSVKNCPELPLLSITREQGVIERDVDNQESNHNFIPDDLSGYKKLEKGQFGMNKMKAWQGSYGVSKFTGIVSPAYFIFDFTKAINPEFFNWAIRSKLYVSFFGSASDGVRIGQWDLSKARMKVIPFVLPSEEEQSLIANFLDKKTALIDEAISIKEQQISLLKERKQIIIQQAVTQGLDPNVPMKDSGVDWIGKIPAHWKIKPLKHILKLQNVKIEAGKSNLEYLGMECVNSFDGTKNEIKSEADGLSTFFQVGNILFGKLRPYLAKVYLADFEGVCSTEFLVYEVKVGSNTFFSKLMLSNGFISVVDASTYGSKMPRASSEFIGNLKLVNPPLEEQIKIASFIDKQNELFDMNIALQKMQIEKLKEYKTTLINSAVTGKIKITPEMVEQ